MFKANVLLRSTAYYLWNRSAASTDVKDGHPTAGLVHILSDVREEDRSYLYPPPAAGPGLRPQVGGAEQTFSSVVTISRAEEENTW